MLLHDAQESLGYDRFASRIPVLMYHKIMPGRTSYPGINYYVNEATFYEQMKFLADHNYRPLTLAAYTDCLFERTPWPERSLLITFDDGYSNVFTLGYPILKIFNFPAVVFVSTQYIGTRMLFPGDRQYSGLEHAIVEQLFPLGWDQIDKMRDIVSIGSHTVSHVLLGSLPHEPMQQELSESKRILEHHTGNTITAFAYPGGLRQHGAYNRRTREALINAGYRVAFNSEIGTNESTSDPYVQRRLTVEAGDSLRLFSAKLTGAYNWVRIAQWCFHAIFKLGKHKLQATAIQRGC
jgi:peptidoglycan/xylan/chitin deacetylase (PgdA/CDA1 family)